MVFEPFLLIDGIAISALSCSYLYISISNGHNMSKAAIFELYFPPSVVSMDAAMLKDIPHLLEEHSLTF
jgi:hypothetical protein